MPSTEWINQNLRYGGNNKSCLLQIKEINSFWQPHVTRGMSATLDKTIQIFKIEKNSVKGTRTYGVAKLN